MSTFVSILCRALGPEAAAKIAGRLFKESLRISTRDKVESIRQRLEKLELEAEDFHRKQRHPDAPVKGYRSNSRKRPLEVMVQPSAAPWKNVGVETRFKLPGMLTKEEIHYFHYITHYYDGQGEIVELGPWLGLSSHHLIDGLSSNPAFNGKRMHVFDDFVWRSDWMDTYYIEIDRPAHHDDFLPIFVRLAADIEDKITVHKGKITDYDGNEQLPSISWNGAPIELLVADCGRTVQANQSWFDLFSPSFIPNKTLVVMQDWRLHRERPRKWFNQTKSFTDQNPSLELIHEINEGGIATFLYRGK